jgi:hypothetical protein
MLTVTRSNRSLRFSGVKMAENQTEPLRVRLVGQSDVFIVGELVLTREGTQVTETQAQELLELVTKREYGGVALQFNRPVEKREVKK